MLLDSDDWPILWLSLKVALVSTLAILPTGVGLAWAMSRVPRGWRIALESVLTLPLVLPPTAVGILLLVLLGKTGPLGRAFDALGIEIVFTWRAAALASAVMSLPLLVRSARTAFEEVDPKLMGIARTLGDGPLRAFWRVALPLSWRGVFAGSLLAFCRALGEFGATILLAGNIPGKTQTLALAIFQRTQTGRDHDALRLVALTSVIALVAVYATQFWERQRESTLSS
jgi:molybdate transport system permease protein